MAELILRPNADYNGSPGFSCSPGTDRYACVDEVVKDEVDYIWQSTGSTCTILFGLPNHTSETGVISSVKVGGYFKQDTASLVNRLKVKIGGSEFQSSDITIGTSVAYYEYEWTQNPNTSSAWTWTDIDNLQAGIISNNTSKNSLNCYQFYVKVTYTTSIYDIEQPTSRFRNDDGSESTATWAAAENVNVTRMAAGRLRFVIDQQKQLDGCRLELEVRRRPSGGSWSAWWKPNCQ